MSIPFPEEVSYLKIIQGKLKTALINTQEKEEQARLDYLKSKRYLAQYRNEIDSMEIFSNERALTVTDQMQEMASGEVRRLEKLLDSSYFGKLQFQYDGEDEAEALYIGLFHFRENASTLIYDWRAPISGMYYDYEPGPASYQAPQGMIEGNILGKRQFKIKAGRLIFALESGLTIDDELLQRELSTTSDRKMKHIIATLQKEQNQIIRNEDAHTLIIQGAAGSGKTSVALHRAAYMLYRHRDTLKASDIALISPNKIFADYISTVLPQLGEDPLFQLNFYDIAVEELKGDTNFISSLPESESSSAQIYAPDELLQKSAPETLRLAANYLQHVKEHCFQPDDLTFGEKTISGKVIKHHFLKAGQLPITQLLDYTAGRIREDLYSKWQEDADLPSKAQIRSRLTSIFPISGPAQLYRDFCQHCQIPYKISNSGKKQLPWADVFPYLYFKHLYEGLHPYPEIKHLIVDEMQDYTAIQYAVVHILFPCSKTILGDFHQRITPYHEIDVPIMQEVFSGATVINLTKCYRSTWEIMNLAKTVLPESQADPIGRHGDMPEWIFCKNDNDELQQIKKQIEAIAAQNYDTMGIITKTPAQARILYETLNGEYPLTLLTAAGDTFSQGITVTSVATAKGLEFDKVVLPGVTSAHYRSDFDRNLLYVACTRAMHCLVLTYQGNPSPLFS